MQCARCCRETQWRRERAQHDQRFTDILGIEGQTHFLFNYCQWSVLKKVQPLLVSLIYIDNVDIICG